MRPYEFRGISEHMSKNLNLWPQFSAPAATPEPRGAAGTPPVPTPRLSNLFTRSTPNASTDPSVWRGEHDANEQDDPIPDSPPDRRYGKRGYKRVPVAKARRQAVSVCVSEEEETILRAYAASLNTSFSDWARQVLFAAMARRLPKRGMRDGGP